MYVLARCTERQLVTTFLSQFLGSGILFQVLKYQPEVPVTVTLGETGSGRFFELLLKHAQAAHNA